MGNLNSSNSLPADLIDTSSEPLSNETFKVDNINSYGRKHASAKIEITNESLCIKQKHRESLHIPLETIKRYGLDGSMFILECGRRAPLGQARYAFLCKQARKLVACLDRRIEIRSKQLQENQQQSESILSSSITLTNVSSTSQHHFRQRAQSDQTFTHGTPSSIVFSSSVSSLVSYNSKTTFSYRNSEPNLSDNYFAFDTRLCDCNNDYNQSENNDSFIAKLKQPIERQITPELNYVQFNVGSIPISLNDEDLLSELKIPIATEEIDNDLVKEPHNEQFYEQIDIKDDVTTKPNNKSSICTNIVSQHSSETQPYVYIDHERTITLKEITSERSQQHIRRIEM